VPFYNCHIHIFSAQCAPKRFLEVGLPRVLDPVSGVLKSFLETRVGRGIMGTFSRAKSPALKVLARYGSFASIGTKATQQMVFENILPHYPPATRFVVLTLNMDYMGAGDSELKFQGQIDEVVTLRRKYPDAVLPFLSVDPRAGSAAEVEAFVRRYVGVDGEGTKPFVGIKLYPALGYFPYDARLRGMYRFCEEAGIPIMTHCTPSGSFFLGKLTAGMGTPETIGGAPSHSFGKNDNTAECDAFLQPGHWAYVLKEFPKLKVCFAHMGGWSEMWPDAARTKELGDAPGWYGQVLHLMAAYPNIYTDVSYTLAETKAERKADHRTWREIMRLLDGGTTPVTAPAWPSVRGAPLPQTHAGTIHQRVLFGTDYFMTEQEESEAQLATKLPEWLLAQGRRDLYTALTESNPEWFLHSAVYTPWSAAKESTLPRDASGAIVRNPTS